jgi:hypothetical protein
MSGLLVTLQPLSAIPIVPPSVIATPTPVHQSLTKITNGAVPLFVSSRPKPDYDKEVLVPLRAAQAKAAEDARIAAEKACTDQGGKIEGVQCVLPPPPVIEVPVVVTSIDTGDSWSRLRQCESGGNYAINTGNGYYGAYQYDLRTWGNYGGYSRPDLAPPTVQDAKARETQSARGWSPWPVCSARLGLSSGGS